MALSRFVGLFLAAGAALVSAQTFDPSKAGPQHWDPAKVGTDKTTNATYNNPIFTENVGDPFVTRYSAGGEDWYLFTYTTTTNITLRRSKALTDNWDEAEARLVFAPDPDADAGQPWSTSVWAPEIHQLNGTWYIIFTAAPDGDTPPPLQDARCPINCPAVNHRMFVLAGDGPDPWTAEFSLKGMLNTYDQFAIDGTYFVYGGQLYHIYSCWEQAYSAWPANLCITHLSDPLTVDSNLTDRRIISVPTEPWERVPFGRPDSRLATNEGPQQLTNPHTDQHFVVYSAARVDTPFYCLGLLELVGDDPMQYHSWRKHRDGCVFHQNPSQAIYGTGHASFTTSPDGSEHYLVYHAQTTPNPAAAIIRTTRTQKFTWNPHDGTPEFPAAAYGPFAVPAGQDGHKPATMRSLSRDEALGRQV